MNHHFDALGKNYLFAEVDRRVRAYVESNPGREIIRLSIGEGCRPLAACVVKAMQDAAAEMGTKAGFRGYGPAEGYDFLRRAIQSEYTRFGAKTDTDEIFISDGAKSDLAHLLEMFSADNTVLVPDPVYPVYVDDNLLDGRRILYAQANAENDFLPMPNPKIHADLIYLCSPNNPTGAAYTIKQLSAWVEYALENDAVILYDAAYRCFLTQPDLARSIYQVKDAEHCAIEIGSFSKRAGFTGTRCGYTVVPHNLERENRNLNMMWRRRQQTKNNGVAYIVQRGAEAALSPLGQKQIQKDLAYYRTNAVVLGEALDAANIWYCGRKNSPYLWLKCPGGMNSWQFFDWLLAHCGIAGTPGAGFGPCGEGYFRLTAFGEKEKTCIAAERLKMALLQR